MNVVNRLRIGAMVAALAVAVGNVSAAEFYGLTANGVLNRFDMAAQTVTAVSSLHAGPTALNHFVELESDGAGNLFAIRAYEGPGGFPPPQINEVVRITSPALGNALLMSSFGGGFGFVHTGLAYRAADSSFYAVRNYDGQLATFNPSTGASTPVSGVGHGSPWFTEGLAINPVTGLAYALVDRGDPFSGPNFALLGMDLATGLSTTIGPLGLGGVYMTGGLRFDGGGNAYTVNPADGNVYTVSTATGAASFLFAGGAGAVGTTGLALIAVPAPAGAAGLLLGGAAAARRRRGG